MRNFLRKLRADGDTAWDDRRMQLVWDAIALHTIFRIVKYKEPEVSCLLEPTSFVM